MKNSLGCLGLNYPHMADDVESLIELLRNQNTETKNRVLGALKSATGKRFLFGEDNPAKWDKK